MHLWSKFGNPDFNQWWLIVQTNSQTQNGVNFDFEVKFDLEGQGQSSPKTIGALTEVFYTYGPNLVILAWTGDESLRRQTWWRTDGRTDWRTDWRTDRRTQAVTIPWGQNWPQVKSHWQSCCTVLMASICLALRLCKETLKQYISSCILSIRENQSNMWVDTNCMLGMNKRVLHHVLEMSTRASLLHFHIYHFRHQCITICVMLS